MPIKITDGLSAKELLHEEGIFTIDKGSALHQDIRPLRILILNLMPLKKPTELQLLRLLGDSPLQVEVDFCRTTSHESVHTDPSYLEQNYYTFDDIKNNYYDGLIITGAPVEQIPFEDVDYWPELTTYLDWSAAHAFSTLYFCWGAQAALYHYYGIEKRLLPEKLFGIFHFCGNLVYQIVHFSTVQTDAFLAEHFRDFSACVFSFFRSEQEARCCPQSNSAQECSYNT